MTRILLVLSSLTLLSDAALMEAKLYIDESDDLARLGDLAGELYVCSRGADESGAYHLLVTDSAELARLRDAGARVEVTWADLDEKFELLTGVDPDDPGRFQDFGYYHTYWEMRDSVTVLATSYPEICSLFTIGVTSQGRDILCLKISDNAAVEEDEPACYFSGSTHGNEPMGTSIVMEYISQVLSGYGRDEHVTWMVDNREIYTVPILNPDCSVFCSDSSGANVYWRKNRRVVQPPHVGVDPSRNHAYKWGCDDVGSSPNPGAHAYRGPAPWSDAEASAARDLELSHRFRTKQDFHCFGGYNCYPWTYTYDPPPELALMREVVDTFQLYNGYHDTLTGQASHVLYLANGTQMDWGRSDSTGKFAIYSFVIEADSWFWACWNDSVLYNLELARNVPTLDYLARIAGAWFDAGGVVVDDSAAGNGTGRLDAGETADIWFTIRNRAIHPVDSAYDITASLVSLDTLVTVLDSTSAFPDVQRHGETENRVDPFRVRAAYNITPGTRVPLRLDVAFIDDGRSYTMPVGFEVVIGDNPVAVGEQTRTPAGVRTATVVGRVLQVPDTPTNRSIPPVLLDALGREVLTLKPGENLIDHLSPGVYYLNYGPDDERRKVVLTE